MFNGVLQNRGQRDRSQCPVDRPGIRTRQIQQLVSQTSQSRCFVHDDLQRLLVFLRRPDAQQSQIRFRSQCGQRRSDFVRGIGGEPTDFVDGGFQSSQQQIQRFCQSSNFIVRIFNVDSLVKAVDGKCAGRPGKLADRAQDATGQPVATDQRAGQ